MSARKISLAVFLFLALSLFLGNVAYAVGSETPTITNYKEFISGASQEYLVVGGVARNSEVLVYIDGNYVDFAEIISSASGNLYQYRLNQELADGQHKLMIIGRDKTSMVLSPPTQELVFIYQSRPKPPAPTIVYPGNNTVISTNPPLITGLAKNGTKVRAYLDGGLVGQSSWLYHKSGTANFAIRPAEKLELGDHHLLLLAEDQYNQVSTSSKIIHFRLEKLLPAPVVLGTAAVDGSRLRISGVALNDLTVKVFIDYRLDGQFKVKNNISGTANFAYITGSALTVGVHTVYTQAVDDRGKESKRSNIVKYTGRAAAKVQPIITPVSASEESAPVVNKPEQEEPSQESKMPDEEKKELEDLLKSATPAKESETGALDESKGEQNKIKWNLIIFVIFLAAVIGWIIWVNRELIKERQEKNKGEIDMDKDKGKDSPSSGAKPKF